MTYHPLDYVEIAVSDLERAKSFYAAAFGWEFNDYGPDYAGIRAASGDLDASLTAVTDAGGSVLEAPYDYPGGRRFICGDPDGNVLGVYQPAE